MSIELVMLSNHLILHRPLLFLPSIFHSITVFSNESALHIRSPKYWTFSFNISPSNEYWWLISSTTAAVAKSLQSCPTLCNTIDGSPPGSSIPGILQARTLEWVTISFSNAWKWKVKVKSLSRVRLLVTSWTAAHQAPPSMGFSRQEYWSGVPLPSPRKPYIMVKTKNYIEFTSFWKSYSCLYVHIYIYIDTMYIYFQKDIIS